MFCRIAVITSWQQINSAGHAQLRSWRRREMFVKKMASANCLISIVATFGVRPEAPMLASNQIARSEHRLSGITGHSGSLPRLPVLVCTPHPQACSCASGTWTCRVSRLSIPFASQSSPTFLVDIAMSRSASTYCDITREKGTYRRILHLEDRAARHSAYGTNRDHSRSDNGSLLHSCCLVLTVC
jgi:hypothetical protein